MKRFLAMALAASLGGCAHTPSDPDRQIPLNPAYSKAMNVLIAAGYVDDPKKSRIRDLPREQAAQAAAGKGSAVTDVGYAVSNVLAPPPGIGFGFALGMSALSLFMPEPEEPLATSNMLGWMPRALAPSPEAAKTAMQGLIDEALDAALAEHLKPPYHPVPRDPKRPWRVAITGGDCSKPGAECAYWTKVEVSPRAGAAPGLLGGGPVWTWLNADTGFAAIGGLYYSAYQQSGILDQPVARLPDLAIYQAMSARLPEWVFLYLAPRTISDGSKFIPFPLMLNRGEALYFIAPAR